MFAPLLPATGLVGFKLLEQTQSVQREIFDRQPEIARDTDYFRETIATVQSAGALVEDRRLLRVALGAFGLDEEIDKRAFIRKILEEGTEAEDAFANRFVDPRYQRLAETFGFGNASGSQTGQVGFAQGIVSAFIERQFEISVGDQNDAYRLALNFRREIARYASSDDPDGSAWFSVMGDLPVRRVFEGAFGLDASFGQLEVDRQRSDLRSLNDRTFGDTSLAVFQDTTQVDRIIDRFLVRDAALNGPSPSTPGFTALRLLTGGSSGFGDFGAQNIVLSQLQS